MQENSDQANTEKSSQLSHDLRRQLKQQQTVRLLLSLILAAACLALILVENESMNTDIYLTLGALLGVLAGMHLSARWLSPSILKAAEHLKKPTQ